MTLTADTPEAAGARPVLDGSRGLPQQIGVYVFVFTPLVALLAAVPLAAVFGFLGRADVVIAAVFYVVSGLGITVGFHRYFTHGSFKANRPLRVALAIAGMLAMQGPVITWVADHRRHHAFSDKEGDPHSPWLFGTGVRALASGTRTWAGSSTGTSPTPSASPRTCSRTGTSTASAACSPCGAS